jgi:tRNA A37 threonylcarbamoyladenosine synthetase subunit TsaC/SUA5/YrdC
VTAAAEALRAGKPAILPTDTVYGLCCSPYRPEPSDRLYALKGRDAQQPTALLAADVEGLFELVPELRGRSGLIARALLPGPYTLVLPNPARRYHWLTGATPEAIGVRVPELSEEAVDGGELPGTPSTVLDFTGDEPRVLREGAAAGEEAIARAVAALA